MARYRTLLLLLVLAVLGRVPAQLTESGPCPNYMTSILFTPVVMLDIINVGEMFLAMSMGSTEDRDSSCQTLTFKEGLTYTYTYLDSSKEKQTVEGSYQPGFPTFVSNAHIKLTGGTNHVLGADFTGKSKLIPIAYGFGIVIFVSCTNYLWFHSQQVFLFMDTDIDIGGFDYSALADTLAAVGIIPPEIQLDIPDQSCRLMSNAKKQRFVKLV